MPFDGAVIVNSARIYSDLGSGAEAELTRMIQDAGVADFAHLVHAVRPTYSTSMNLERP